MQILQRHQPDASDIPAPTDATLTTVLVVTSDFDVLESSDCGASDGPFDRVLITSRQYAYAQIRSLQPSLVVVCMRFDDLDSYQLLTMLAMNPDTRRIRMEVLVLPDHQEEAGAERCGFPFPGIPIGSNC
jgi:hypothetical protein